MSSESTNKLKIYQSGLYKNNIKTLSASENQQKIINKVIFHVMSGTQGKNDKEALKKIIKDFSCTSAEAIILGCTELPLVINQNSVDIKIFDTTKIIAEVALKYAFLDD